MARLLSADIDSALNNGAVLVTPNQRLARACLADFARLRTQEGKLGWPTPHVVPFQSWLQSLYRDLFATGRVSKRLLSEEQSLALWREVINQSDTAAVLSLNATATSVANAWEIENSWVIDLAPSALPLTEDQAQYELWKKHYLDLCAERGCIDSACVSRTLQESLADSLGVLPEQLVLFGFPEVSTGVRQFLAHLSTLGCQVHEALPENSQSPDVTVVSCRDDESELRQCANWARQCYTDMPESSASVGIVIPDLHARRDAVIRAFDAVFYPASTPADIAKIGRPYDVSLGLPLSRFAPVEHALMFLEFAYDQLGGGELSRFLLSPYLADAAKEQDARAAYDARLRADRVRIAGIGRLRTDRGTPALLRDHIHKTGDTLKLGRAQPSIWLSRFIEVLEALGWPGNSASGSVEYQAIEAWFKALEQLQGLDDIVGNLSWRSMLTLLREHIQGLIFQPQTPELPIQILGILESQGLRFDKLRVLGMDNESWPPVTTASPFLPLKWQKLASVPGAASDIDVARSKAIVALWMRAADSVTFSHASHRNASELHCAAVLSDHGIPKIESAIDEQAYASEVISNLISLTGIADYSGPGVAAEAQVGGGARLFEDQAHCPFRAYVVHRLGIRELEEPGLGIDARDKGNLFHDTVQYFWQDVKSLIVLRTLLESEDDFAQQLNKSIDAAFENADIGFSALRDIEKRRVFRVARQWLVMHEKLRDAFTVRELEDEKEFVFGPLQLKLKVDRVDELDTGGAIIIDYKTGKYNSTSSWVEPRITSPQLPLYAVLQDKPVDAVCFAQVATNEQKFVGMGVQRGVLPGIKEPATESASWTQQLEDWRERLTLLAEEINAGVATVTPGKKSCARCPLPSVCRVDASVVDSAEENAGQESGLGLHGGANS
ncbi:MAG: PD-(D/E)XK nuclease family protein [Granulosicoccus sp.]|nr:PD-(D/E)XK nuclease family protein [Granulosicoccus sp.]